MLADQRGKVDHIRARRAPLGGTIGDRIGLRRRVDSAPGQARVSPRQPVKLTLSTIRAAALVAKGMPIVSMPKACSPSMLDDEGLVAVVGGTTAPPGGTVELVVLVVLVVLVEVSVAGSTVVDGAPGVSGTMVTGVAFDSPAGGVVPDVGIVEVVGEVGPGGVNDPRTAERIASK